MKITLLQTDIVWASISENINKVEHLLQLHAAEGSDLFVLPEMWSTGFATEPSDIADATEQSLAFMKKMAKQLNAAIAGSVATREQDGQYYNRLYFVTPDEVYYYDKRHLFSYGGENLHYTHGKKKVIVEWRGVRILLQVCYDLRFPCFSRYSAVEPYDMILYVANWPENRRRLWDTLLQARAIENQCYVAGVNRVGDDNFGHYNGGTCIIDAYGRIAATTEDNHEQTVTHLLDFNRQRTFRSKFRVLDDADDIRELPL